MDAFQQGFDCWIGQQSWNTEKSLFFRGTGYISQKMDDENKSPTFTNRNK